MNELYYMQLSNERYVAKLMRPDDCRRFGDAYSGAREIARRIATRFRNHEYGPDIVREQTFRGKVRLSAVRYDDILFLRHCGQKLRRGLKHHPPTRHQIVRQLREVLTSDTPLHVYRTDVRNCFGTIRGSEVMAMTSVRKCFTATEYQWCRRILGCDGDDERPLHHGLAIGAELTEHFLADFDRTAMCIPGVVYATRFVDDVLLVSVSGNECEIMSLLQEALPGRLQLNKSKTADVHWQLNRPVNASFDYLGYRFTGLGRRGQKSRNAMSVGLAKKKC